MTLYLTHGDLYRPGSSMVSHFCGLPVRADSEDEARRKTLAVLGDGSSVCGIRETNRMPILDWADDYIRGIVSTLTEGES